MVYAAWCVPVARIDPQTQSSYEEYGAGTAVRGRAGLQCQVELYQLSWVQHADLRLYYALIE